MKSEGNSGAQFRLEDSAGTILTGGGLTAPVGPVQSVALVATQNWFNPAQYDTVRYRTVAFVAPSDMTVYVVLKTGGTAGAKAWFDGIKLEESTVATPWSPAAIGATVIDAGGVQIDGFKGGVFRYKGTTGGTRDTVEGGPSGLILGGDTEITAPADGSIAVDGVVVALARTPVVRVYTGNATWTKPAAATGFQYAVIEAVGGGGAGGGSAGGGAAGSHAKGGGGGSGGYSRRTVLAAALGATEAVTVGAGGTGVSAAAGNNGADSSLGTLVVAKGGTGGATSGNNTATYSGALGGAGGVAGTGDVTATGGRGGYGFGSLALATAGNGGDSIWGTGGAPAAALSQPSSNVGGVGSAYGGGGGGAVTTGTGAANVGGAGAAGVVVVTEYYA
jgi:hypothetical protein